MDLDDRKLKILQAVIKNYLETGEPVGSRTISKYTDLNLSSATIRNEMADLEELGYIVQPHTSAGRIPTDKGYRLYVDTLMQEKVDEVNNMRDLKIIKTIRRVLKAKPDFLVAYLHIGGQYNKEQDVQIGCSTGKGRCAEAKFSA